MLRRRLLDQPQVSRLALWARRLAIFSLPVALLAIIIERAGLFEIDAGPGDIRRLARACRCWRSCWRFAALIGIWIDGRAGAGYALVALFVSLVLLAYPGYLGVKAYRLPADSSTSPPTPTIRHALKRSRGCARARPIRSPMAGLPPISSSARPIRTSTPLIAPDVHPQVAYDAALLRSSPNANGASSTHARRSRPPRWPHRGDRAHARSWDFATTS